LANVQSPKPIKTEGRKAAPKPTIPVRPHAGPAKSQRRHKALFLSFIFLVVLPTGFSAWYLWERAIDKFASNVGFTVRREEAPSAVDILGGLTNLPTSSSSDSDVLFEFIQSQDLVAKMDTALNLRKIYSQDYAQDPLFSLKPGASMEELIDHWQRDVQVSYAPSTGLIEVRALAPDAQTARTIAQMLFDECSIMINALSETAREDAMRYARADLELSVGQLKTAREEMTSFRTRTQIVDPLADIQIQLGILTTMQQKLGDELITLDLLRQSVLPEDPRLAQSEQRIAAIRARIKEEREKFGARDQGPDGEDYATLVGEFERLSVDQQFAEQKYASGLVNYDLAQKEAQRQSRYLAAYIKPTLAETSQNPDRPLLVALTLLFSLFIWGILALIYYSLRDRR
jgi:capsular polysaccharide transport system permease protein